MFKSPDTILYYPFKLSLLYLDGNREFWASFDVEGEGVVKGKDLSALGTEESEVAPAG